MLVLVYVWDNDIELYLAIFDSLDAGEIAQLAMHLYYFLIMSYFTDLHIMKKRPCNDLFLFSGTEYPEITTDSYVLAYVIPIKKRQPLLADKLPVR